MASWQAAWFFMPKLHTISWTARTSTFPYLRFQAGHQKGVPTQIVNLSLYLVWNHDYERVHGNEFNIVRLGPSGMQLRVTTLHCTSACAQPMPRYRMIRLQAASIEIVPVSALLQFLDVSGSKSISFRSSRFLGAGRLPMNRLGLASEGLLQLELSDPWVVKPRIMRLTAHSLQAPGFAKLLSNALTELSILIVDPSHSSIDLKTLPQGARSASWIDEVGYHFHWTV